MQLAVSVGQQTMPFIVLHSAANAFIEKSIPNNPENMIVFMPFSKRIV
jgi:hypothetical protein